MIRSLAALALLVFPQQAALWNEIAILALFAISLDLVLGYAGILTLGHAAFFGTGCYAAALFAKYALHDPLAGLAVGIPAAWGATRLLRSVLFGTSPTDPLVFVSVSVLLALVALAASWLPARRAGRVDPILILRSE